MSCNAKIRPNIVLEDFQGILSSSPEMKKLFSVIDRVAKTDSTVLIRGETGTGKELVARAMHGCSTRSEKPFRAINCATLTKDLLASEMFGHVKGAFTGAVSDHKGLFAQAESGTVFLDEIAELPLSLQAQLLRVLQERTFVPVGGTSPQKVNVRMLAATNKALRTEVAEGRFREDLMYRVRVVPIFLPPLVERQGDLEALLWNFIDEFNCRGPRCIGCISHAAHEAIMNYSWPGNIRELRNLVEYAFAIGEGNTLDLSDLMPELRGVAPHRTRGLLNERQKIQEALEKAKGRKAVAAGMLEMSRSTLWRKIKEHNL